MSHEEQHAPVVYNHSTANMFATHSGTPYGGYGLGAVPNAADGQGNASLQGPNAPLPSGGLWPSVANQSLDLVVNDTPSVLMTPSRSPHLSVATNKFVQSDLVFVAVARAAPAGLSYVHRRNRPVNTPETAMMTINTVNAELRRYARERLAAGGASGSWFTEPYAVANWIRPVGAVLNVQQSGTVNVCVSRRAVVRHSFTSNTDSGISALHCQSMDPVAIMYSVVKCKLVDGQDTLTDVTQLWTVVLQEGECVAFGGRDVQMDATSDDRIHTRPVARDAVTGAVPGAVPGAVTGAPVCVSIGRVLHSPPRCPTVAECLHACLLREAMLNMGTLEIQLGCP